MRDPLIDARLAQTVWADWDKAPIAGDASARRYFRLTKTGQPPAILMDDPPDGTAATTRFADIALALIKIDLRAPQIWLHDADIGLMVIEDLGQDDFAAHLRWSLDCEVELYDAAVDILARLHGHKFTLPLTTITPAVAADMIGLAALHYAPTKDALGDLHDAMLVAYTSLVDPTPHLALRDFHAENLIWRPDMTGADRVGLLDFQDACYAPAGYDLMSLLRDVRRDVTPDIAVNAIAKFGRDTGLEQTGLSAHLACVSVQRNLRILGVFARLAKLNGKAKYLSLLPRTWAHLMCDLNHPALMDLKTVVLKTLPPPNQTTLTRLAAL